MKLPLALLLIVAAAAVICAPSLFVAEPGDSFSYTLNWSRQFTQQVLAGDPYPRWTAASFGGLGAPTFYFYPPLPFWGVAALGGATRGLLSAADQVKAAEFAFLALSGLTMFAWLRTQASAGWATLGGVLYMIAPYHLDDHYVRGAFAEFAAFALLPVVGLGLAWVAARRRLGALVLAAGWAALILCHLPTALLAGVTLIGPYGLFLLWRAHGRRIAVAGAMAFALAIGTGLAAIYVIPSLTLQDAISAEYWWSAQFQVGGRLFANPAAWRLPLEPFFGFISLGEAAIAAVLGWRARRRPDRQPVFWAGVVVALFLIMAGLAPGFWSLPLLAKVQFPWRAMALQDFAFVTLFAWSGRTERTPLIAIAFAALICGNLLAVARDLVAGPSTAAAARAGYGAASFPTDADAPEYLPRGMLRMTTDGPAPAIPYRPLVAGPLVTGPVAGAAADPVSGAVRMTMAPGQAGLVVVRRFDFPAWRVRCDGRPEPTFAAGPGKLLGFRSRPGQRVCEAAIGVTRSEYLGAAAGFASLALLAGYGLWIAIGVMRRRGEAQSASDAPSVSSSRPVPCSREPASS